MELQERDPNHYQGWHPDGREIFVYRQIEGTARVAIYGQSYPGNPEDQAY